MIWLEPPTHQQSAKVKDQKSDEIAFQHFVHGWAESQWREVTECNKAHFYRFYQHDESYPNILAWVFTYKKPRRVFNLGCLLVSGANTPDTTWKIHNWSFFFFFLLGWGERRCRFHKCNLTVNTLTTLMLKRKILWCSIRLLWRWGDWIFIDFLSSW